VFLDVLVLNQDDKKNDDLGMQGESPYTPPAEMSADKQTLTGRKQRCQLTIKLV